MNPRSEAANNQSFEKGAASSNDNVRDNGNYFGATQDQFKFVQDLNKQQQDKGVPKEFSDSSTLLSKSIGLSQSDANANGKAFADAQQMAKDVSGTIDKSKVQQHIDKTKPDGKSGDGVVHRPKDQVDPKQVGPLDGKPQEHRPKDGKANPFDQQKDGKLAGTPNKPDQMKPGEENKFPQNLDKGKMLEELRKALEKLGDPLNPKEQRAKTPGAERQRPGQSQGDRSGTDRTNGERTGGDRHGGKKGGKHGGDKRSGKRSNRHRPGRGGRGGGGGGGGGSEGDGGTEPTTGTTPAEGTERTNAATGERANAGNGERTNAATGERKPDSSTLNRALDQMKQGTKPSSDALGKALDPVQQLAGESKPNADSLQKALDPTKSLAEQAKVTPEMKKDMSEMSKASDNSHIKLGEGNKDAEGSIKGQPKDVGNPKKGDAEGTITGQKEKDLPPGGAPKDHGVGNAERNKEKDIPPGGKPKEGWDSAERNRDNDKVIPPGGAPKETDVLSPDRRPVDLPPGTSKPEENIRDFNHPPDIRDKEDRPANLEDSVKGQAGADFFAGGDGTASDATGPKIGDSADKSPEERRKENAKRAADILSGKGDLGNDYQRGQIQEMYRQAMASEGPEGVAALTKAINDALAESGSDVRINTKTGTETGEFAHDSGNKSIYVPNQQAQIQTVNIEVQRGGTKTDQGKAEVVPSQYTKHPWSRVPLTPGTSGFSR